MERSLSPNDLAAAAEISQPYASLILTGKRPASTKIALSAFRTFGVRLGLLAEMTDDDIEKLCGECLHAPADTPAAGAVSGGNDAETSAPGQSEEVAA